MGVMYGIGFWYGGIMIADSTDKAIAKFPPPSDMLQEGSPWYGTIREFCASYVNDQTSLEVCGCGLPWEFIGIVSPNCGCGAIDPDLPLGQEPCFSGGQTLMVFFSILLGGIAIGQVGPGLKALLAARISAAKMLEVTNRYPDIVL